MEYFGEYLNKDERNPFTIYRENLGTIDGDKRHTTLHYLQTILQKV